MSAMTNFTMRSLRANRVRTVVTMAGVALAAALIAAIFTSYASLTDFLYRAEAATTGAWMSYAEGEDTGSFAEQLDDAKNDPNVTSLATFSDKGYAQLTPEQQNTVGQYLSIIAAEGDLESLTAVKPTEGRLPENEHEVLLYRGWQTSQGVQIGDTLTFSVGERQALTEGGSSYVTGEGTTTFEPGDILHFSTGYLDATNDGGSLNEQLINLHEESYTVVGFYDRANYALSSNVGTEALTRGKPASGDFTRVFLLFDAVGSSEDVREQTEQLFPDSDVVLHTAMLRYMGISSDASIWKTFNSLVVILATIIALACVSLIFNAFNISVTERMNGFALLSSIGATPAQLRRSVLLEGLIIALIGIPLGLIIGLLGCAVTFAVLGPAIADIAGGGIVPFELDLDVGALAIAAALTLVTVLISAWVPSKRASRVNIIDALRQNSSSRVSERGKRQAEKSNSPDALARLRGLSGRLFGIGGTLARVNRKRGTSKGRAAALSLALAIVLLMTAGSLNTFLSSLVDAASGSSHTAGEVGVSTQFMSKDQQNDAASAQQLLEERNRLFAEKASAFDDFYGALAAVPEAEGVGWLLKDRLVVTVPSEMQGSAFEHSNTFEGGRLSDGTYATTAQIVYLDDESFDRYAREIGQEPSQYHDHDHPRAIALAQGYSNDGQKYQLMNVLREVGTIDVVAAATVNGEAVADIGFTGKTDESGNTYVEFAPFVVGADDNLEAPSDDGQTFDTARVPLEIAALTEQPPMNTSPGDGVLVVVPESLARTQGFGCSNPLFYSYFDSIDGDHAALAEALYERGSDYLKSEAPFDATGHSYNDYVEERDSTQMLATIVNVFCLLFTVILALIAMANVFNTITNSLILRQREFAVMRSIGLSPKQFRSLIIDECVHFGIAGLIPGLIVSLFVSLLLFAAITQSIDGMTFMLPWGYMGIAILMTATIMIISVLYGLHRCKSNNVVEALRADNI